MKISILDRQKDLPQEMRELAKRRLLFVLSRFDSKIDRVLFVIDDVNGPRGGIDKFCQVTVKLKRRTEVRATCEDAKLEVSIARVADRVGGAVSRTIERSQRIDRRQPIYPEQ